MNKLRQWSLIISTVVSGMISAHSEAQQFNQPTATPSYPTTSQQNALTLPQSKGQLRIGIVNTKKCLEESKLGKQEQANFEKMKQQMESVLQDKEKILEEIESKLNDDDYMDSVSDEVASELKRKRRTIRNEGMQLQNQYMQALQQTNMKIIQKLTDAIAKASAQVARDTTSGSTIDVIFTDEACTYYDTATLDVSKQVIEKMNATYETEQKDSASKSR